MLTYIKVEVWLDEEELKKGLRLLKRRQKKDPDITSVMVQASFKRGHYIEDSESSTKIV